MNRWTVLLAMIVIGTFIAMGCSGGGDSPVTPTTDPAITASGSTPDTGQAQTHLWGYYDCYIDLETMTVEAVPNREVMFTANVVQFLNGNPANLGFNIINTPPACGGSAIDVDIEVSITHPFPGLNQYDGYDVRGVFIGDGSATMMYDSHLKYGVECFDQTMLDCWKCTPPCPDFCERLCGSPDGYTRWYNPTEFPVPGLFGYKPGVLATPGYTGDATLNPYKYFADGLGKCDDLWQFLTTTANYGVFTSGSKNTRNYYLRFPTPSPGVKFNYAVLADWISNTTHPANCIEAVGCSVAVTDNIWHDGTNFGGDLIVDIDLFGWVHQPSVYLESSVLGAVHPVTPTTWTPTGGGSTWDSDLYFSQPATNVSGPGCVEEFWVIAEYPAFNYADPIYNPNGLQDTLAAFFRYCLFVADTPYNTAPVVDSGVDGNDEPFFLDTETYTVTAHDVDLDPLTYTWTVTDNSTSTPVTGYDGVPGDGAGNLHVDWDTVGAANLDEYDIDCEVSDSIAPPVPATTLTVTATNVLWEDDMESGEGEWMKTHSGTGNGTGWAIVSGGNNNWWHSNNGTNYLTPSYCAKLWTPQISIPSGVSSCHVEFFHTCRGYFWANTISQGATNTRSLDGGSTYIKMNPPVVSGPQYTNWTYPYTSTYFWALVQGCGSVPGGGWGWAVWANTTATGSTTVLDYSSQIGNDIRIGFIFASYHYSSNYYWGIDDIKVIVDP